ncbi:hypothetical protein DFAR_2120005 [Desulfarculales bacterium]
MYAIWGNRRRWITPDWLCRAFPTWRVPTPAERLSMRKVKEVLRLKHEAGCGNRNIAKSCVG